MSLSRTLAPALAGLAILLPLSMPAQAESLGGSFSIGQYQLDEEAAEADNYKSSGLGLSIDLGYTHKGLRGAIGLGSVFLADEAGFSQTVEDQYGNVSEAESNAGITFFTLEGGYEYDLTPALSASVNAGYMLLTGSRSIENCSDCNKEDFDLTNGLYLQPKIGYYFAEWGLGASYLYSQSSTVQSAFALSLIWRL